MPIEAVWVHIDGEHVIQSLGEAVERLDSGGGELVLDFSSVRRMDSDAIAALERLATAASIKSVRVVLRGVNVDVYKVLTLLKLAPRFSFTA